MSESMIYIVYAYELKVLWGFSKAKESQRFENQDTRLDKNPTDANICISHLKKFLRPL